MVERLVVDTDRWEDYREYARGLGFRDMAAAPSGKIEDRDQMLRDWVGQGYAADMHWFGRGLEKRLDPSLVVPHAASIIMLTTVYEKEPCTLAGHKLARYACGTDYHDVVLSRLKTLCAHIWEDYPNANLRHYVDTGPVLERYWAEKAGLGWIGKNGNLIEREAGSYLFLASIVSDLRTPYGTPHEDYCGACRACIDACPTDAIVSEGVVDARKCISYLNIEHRGSFPEDTPEFSDWIFGCDICQEVCPWVNKFSLEPQLAELKPREDYASTSEDDIAEMDQEGFSRLFRKSPIKRTKMAGLKRNLAHLRRGKAE